MGCWLDTQSSAHGRAIAIGTASSAKQLYVLNADCVQITPDTEVQAGQRSSTQSTCLKCVNDESVSQACSQRREAQSEADLGEELSPSLSSERGAAWSSWLNAWWNLPYVARVAICQGPNWNKLNAFPHMLEMVSRFSWVRGDVGDLDVHILSGHPMRRASSIASMTLTTVKERLSGGVQRTIILPLPTRVGGYDFHGDPLMLFVSASMQLSTCLTMFWLMSRNSCSDFATKMQWSNTAASHSRGKSP